MLTCNFLSSCAHIYVYQMCTCHPCMFCAVQKKKNYADFEREISGVCDVCNLPLKCCLIGATLETKRQLLQISLIVR